MGKYLKYIICLLALIPSGLQAQHSTFRQAFNDGWKFRLDSLRSWSSVDADDSGWTELSLPHDWSIEGHFDKGHPATPGGGALPGGVGWYRRHFRLSPQDRSKWISVAFEGVYQCSEVWINGHYLGKRPNGYVSFSYDLSPYLHFGSKDNLLVVRVDNSRQPNSRWYSGSGIYRNVWLHKKRRLHIAHNGTFVSTPKLTAQGALVSIEAELENKYPVQEAAVIRHRILTKAGKVLSENTSRALVPASGRLKVSASMQLENPGRWSPDSPTLHYLHTEIFAGGKLQDKYITPFGVRSFYFDADSGFYLNGKKLQIRGVCNHHDLGALGAAFNRRAAERQLELLKDMGCNAIRTSHNAPAPELLDLCDEMGFFVMDEAFDIWKKQKNPYDYHLYWDEWHKRDLEDFVKRDRNHASIFVWSVGNEIQEQWGDAEKGDTSGRSIARELVRIVRSLDTSRAVTTANNEINTWNNLLQSGAFDLIGYNYNHKAWAGFPKRWPGKKLIITESTSALATRGAYDRVSFDSVRRWPEAWDKPIKGGGNADLSVSAYDHVSAPWGSTHEESLRTLQANRHVAGMFVWTGFDYLGEPTPYPWPARSSYFGIIDLAGFPKDAYWLYKSQWTRRPVLHVYPHWNWAPGDTVDIVAYFSGAEEVELFLNGRSLGRRSKEGGRLHVKWSVPYVAGTLKAVSYQGGAEVLTRTISTAGAATKIILEADRTKIKADKKDLSFVKVYLTDGAGNLVPHADSEISFQVSGEGSLKAVDNGSPVSLESFKGTRRKLFNGLALAIIQAGERPGTVKLTAGSPGLPDATIYVRTE